MSSNNKSIFITGGLGYVGSRVARYLAAQGFRVKVGSQRASRLAKPSWLSDGDLVPYSTEYSVSQLEDLLRGIDIVYHLAAPNEIVSAAEPERALIENSVGTLRLCQAAENVSIARFVFLSTAHVYKAPLEGEFSESDACLPTHPYAYSHLVAENIVHSFSKLKAVPHWVVVRLTNAVGYPDRTDTNRWTLIANDLCRQAVNQGVLHIRSNPLARRDFVSMHDVTRALCHLGAVPLQNRFDIFNLGSGHSMTLLELARTIADEAAAILGTPVDIQHRELNDMAAHDLRINIGKLKDSGFSWLHDLRAELRATVNFCKEQAVCTRTSQGPESTI